MKHILVAVDKIKNAELLTSHAVKLAKLTGGKIWIIQVGAANPTDLLSREAGPQYLYDKRTEDNNKAAIFLKEFAQNLQEKCNIPTEGMLIEGAVIKSIKKIVEENNIDLVIAGHRKKNVIYGLFTENKKKDLIDELNIPLLAIPLG
ncbi:universal stress protein [Bizionia paragorgiae]|uniref:Universal stress protein n=1 Tax=Bizionia paragorgiae TaxID=283786 RepID=A0A1H3ZER3_BIZPA|nr:universal stress protein [Bizionia paragorgiae]MDX1271328.1 universal stress protein [Bizionia paragorgiae]SEA21998.1 Nucleotide-binding universal stress protein, UspA family [Bizionia paragorgiae]